MSTNIPNASGAKVTGDFTQFVGELGRKADTNKDGQVSTAEFGSFLTGLVESAPKLSAAEETRRTLDTVAGILSRHQAGPAGLRDALPELQRSVPGLALSGHDHLDIPGLGRINVGFSFGNTGGRIWSGGR